MLLDLPVHDLEHDCHPILTGEKFVQQCVCPVNPLVHVSTDIFFAQVPVWVHSSPSPESPVCPPDAVNGSADSFFHRSLSVMSRLLKPSLKTVNRRSFASSISATRSSTVPRA